MTSIESGTVFKLRLPFDMGVCYAKMIDFGEIRSYCHVTIYVYDYFEDKVIPDITFFKDVPLFMNPLPIYRPPNVKGKGSWKRLGILHEGKDKLIPTYKDPVEECFALKSLEKYEEIEWNALVNLKQYIGPLDFNQVRHLEEIFVRSTVTIENRIVMNILRYKGEDVEAFFKIHDKSDSWHTDYKTMRYMPLYKEIPEPIRGKPLISGYVPDEYLDWKW